MRIGEMGRFLIGVVILLGLYSGIYAMTNEEMLRTLDEKVVKGEISEELYRELKAKYSGGTKATPSSEVKQEYIEPPVVEGNLIKNGAFEEGTKYWSQEGDGTIEIDNTVFHAGKASLKVHTDSKGTFWVHQYIRKLSVQGPAKYRLTVWVKTENLKAIQRNPKFYVDLRPVPIAPRPQLSLSKNLGTNNWKKFTLDIELPPIETIKIVLSYAHQPETVWLDDIFLAPLKEE